MVPLDSVVRKPAPSGERLFVPPKRPPRPPKAPGPPAPRIFKIVDVTSRAVLAEGTGARATLDVLSTVASIVDVHVFVWEPKPERWRLLALAEQRLLWERRDHERP
jgi:hypothetical protein